MSTQQLTDMYIYVRGRLLAGNHRHMKLDSFLSPRRILFCHFVGVDVYIMIVSSFYLLLEMTITVLGKWRLQLIDFLDPLFFLDSSWLRKSV